MHTCCLIASRLLKAWEALLDLCLTALLTSRVLIVLIHANALTDVSIRTYSTTELGNGVSGDRRTRGPETGGQETNPLTLRFAAIAARRIDVVVVHWRAGRTSHGVCMCVWVGVVGVVGGDCAW